MQELDIIPLFNAIYSPELNPIEKIWSFSEKGVQDLEVEGFFGRISIQRKENPGPGFGRNMQKDSEEHLQEIQGENRKGN